MTTLPTTTDDILRFCRTREEFTPEELEEMERRSTRMLAVCSEAHAHAKAQGLGRDKGGQGQLPCPIEGCGGTIRYVVSSVNGHMMGACSTKGCASWME